MIRLIRFVYFCSLICGLISTASILQFIDIYQPLFIIFSLVKRPNVSINQFIQLILFNTKWRHDVQTIWTMIFIFRLLYIEIKTIDIDECNIRFLPRRTTYESNFTRCTPMSHLFYKSNTFSFLNHMLH